MVYFSVKNKKAAGHNAPTAFTLVSGFHPASWITQEG